LVLKVQPVVSCNKKISYFKRERRWMGERERLKREGAGDGWGEREIELKISHFPLSSSPLTFLTISKEIG
jgi:hypothetical protein